MTVPGYAEEYPQPLGCGSSWNYPNTYRSGSKTTTTTTERKFDEKGNIVWEKETVVETEPYTYYPGTTWETPLGGITTTNETRIDAGRIACGSIVGKNNALDGRLDGKEVYR